MSKPVNILLVEDSPHEAELIQSSMEQHGYDVSMLRVWDATTMSAALADGIWDVVISDYVLPGFSGPKALELYRKQGLDIPFICISGKVGEEEAVGMIRAGAHDFVMKLHLERLPVVVELELALAEKRRQQKQVARSVRHLAAIVEGTDDAVIGKDLSGTILSWNRAAEVMYGYTTGEMIGENISTIVPPEKSGEMESILEKLRDGKRTERFETLRLHKDGKLIDVSLTISPVCDDLGRVIGASSISRDISERRRQEQERLKLIEELQHSLMQVKLLSGLLPICSNCKKIRDEKGLWHQLEMYIRDHSEVSFSHGVCPECMKIFYPVVELKRR
jgi:PAS domain S-box-containing protein